MANTKSLRLDKSVPQYLYITNANQTNLSFNGSNLTFEIDIKIVNAPSNAQMRLFEKLKTNNPSSGFRYLYRDVGGTKQLVFFAGESHDYADVSVNVDLGTGVWKHVTVSFNPTSNEVKFYVDDSQVGTTQTLTKNIGTNSYPLYIGIGDDNDDGSPESGNIDAYIDNIRMWSIERSLASISADRATELVGNESGLQLYCKLNDSLSDETANGNDLTAVGSPSYSADVPFVGAGPSFIPKAIAF